MAFGRPITLTNNVVSKIIRVIATNNQTAFTVAGGYRINQIGVFRNGVRLSNNSDFTAQDGVVVTLANAAQTDDEVLFEIQDDFRVADAIVSAASSQTINGDLSITGNLYYQGSATGILTTGGDGSNLTNVVNSVIAGDNISVSGATGNVTITGLANTAIINADSLNVTGITTVTTLNATTVSIAGTLTYEDVTNIDSVGIVTARSGVIASGIGLSVSEGGVRVTGVVTATSFTGNVTGNLTGDVTGNLTGDVTGGTITASTGANLNGYKVEEGDIETTSLNGEFDYNLENGHIQKFTGSTGGNYQPDFKVNGSTTLSSIMDVGDVVTCTLMVASSSHYLASASIKIDDSASNLDIDNVGGSAPSGANGSGFDIYTFTIQKTAATPAYHIVVNTLGAN